VTGGDGSTADVVLVAVPAQAIAAALANVTGIAGKVTSGINRMAVKAWAKDLHRHLAAATVADIVSLLSTLLNEAVEDRRIPANLG
jgi:predicted dinucleotide-binding enzyme